MLIGDSGDSTHDARMAEQQLDLFAHSGAAMERWPVAEHTHHALLPAEIDDESLIAAIPNSTLAEGCKLPKPGAGDLPRPCRRLPRCAAASPGSALAA